ncbi:TetR family transcriptional regulator [Listeria ivanovii]|uniref:TetR/AcrR family transcriptional regulator n=1 Tax=Listeria ivanovii TaxID=1638 RepID=UPI000DA7F3B0|nr:TetR/AcrR family transcriptional regulator [Listeria ivanovii]PZG33314.1 TetR family transcriptional regulator [Listeria ivanovii]PZG47180.1 TetR family transcriptional regulator [Listeria ivanovii]PZH10965.1 TetR family transcriptional regulator [Listeria ivanovii]
MAESLITKNAIASGLMELCQNKRFEKISITDITNICGLNRQTFYYHFTDKYDLLSWTYENDVFHCLADGITLENWDNHVLKMLESMKLNADFYKNTVSADVSILTSSFSKLTCSLFMDLFEKLDTNAIVKKSDRVFYAEFFSYGCSGVLVTWISRGLKEAPETIANQFFRLAKDTEFLASRMHQEEN